MTAKSKGRPLPPLLPLEYCTVSRAAKMLDCEVDDFYHWAEIGAITLNVMLPDLIEGIVLIDKNETELAGALSAAFDGVFFGYSYISFRGQIAPLEYDPNTLSLNMSFIGGLWEIEAGELEGCLVAGKDNFSTRYLFSATDLRKDKFYVSLDDEIIIQLDRLIITRKQIEKLYAAITTGEPLPNRFNSTEIANEFREREKDLNSNPKQDRLTPGKAKAVTALTELALRLAGEDADLMNNPHKLHRRINELMLEHKANKDGGYSLGISDTAYRDLIGAGRSAQKKDSK